MRRSFIRLLALLLCLAALSGLLPAAAAGGFSGIFKTATVWDRIYGFQAEYVRANQLQQAGLVYEDYCSIAGEIAAIVNSSPDVVKGSCTYDPDSGNATFFWDGTDGNAYGYSPSLAAQLSGRKLGDPEAADLSETISYAPQAATNPSGEIYVIGPWYGSDSSFTRQYRNEANSIAQAIGGTCTVYSGTNATLDNVATAVQNGTVVFFDSHGVTDYDDELSYKDNGDYVYDSVTKANTSYLTLTTNSGWTSEDKATVQGTFGSYKHAWSYKSADGDNVHCVDGTAIAAHMTGSASDSMVWMALCLGMATDGLFDPLCGKGVEVVYGYSQSVSFDNDYLWEADFWDQMKAGKTVKEAFAYSIERNGQWDFCTDKSYNTIGKARYYMCAFPNVVSAQDSYQGQRSKNPSNASAANQTAYNADYGADNIQTVYSGWALFEQYTVTVTVRNPDYGSASVNGNTITASPVEGYYVSEANVLSGEAKTSISGNTVTVSPSSDCTIEIVFAPKTPVTVTCLSNGVEAGTVQGYAGDPITLPDTAPAYADWTFCGWSADAFADTTSKPAFYEPGGSFVPLEDTTVYAVYAKTEPGEGTGDWTLLTDDDVLQTGLEFVFACKSQNVVAGALNNTFLTSVNCTAFSNNIITTLPDGALIFTLGGSEAAWTFDADDGTLYCSTVKKLNFSGTGTGTWEIEVSSGSVTVESTESAYGTLQYNKNSPRFTTYTSNQTAIQIYYLDGSAGITTYSTNPVTCAHSNLTATPAKDPTCAEEGNTAYWTCGDCGRIFADADAKTQISLSDTVIPATGNHTFGACTPNKDGTHSRVCSVCTLTETENCVFEDVVTPPTESGQGYTTHTCSVCAYSYADNYIEPLGPTYMVTFTVPDGSGVTPPADMGCNRLGITLPTAADFTLDDVSYTFTGWVTDKQDHVDVLPSEVLNGSYVATKNVTLNALYAYQDGNAGTEKTCYTTVLFTVCEHSNLTATPAKDPTCAEEGNTAYWTCGDCGLLFADAEAKTQISLSDTVLPATGNHTFGAFTPNRDGTHSRVCSVCKKTETENCVFEDVVTPPTESGKGYTTHTCSVCSYSYTDNYVDPLGPTYTVSFAVPAGSGVTPPADMGCNRLGITLPTAAGFTLDGVAYTFTGWVTAKQDHVDALPSDVLNGPYVATGNITLNALYAYQDGNAGTEKTCYTTVLVTVCEHTGLQTVAAVEPTCVKEGHTAYYYCPDCGGYYSDAACETEITLEETVIPATGVHTFGNPEWVWASDRSSAKAVFTCTVCKQTVSADAAVSVSEDKGVRYYTASVLFEGTTYTSDPNGQKEWIDYTVRFIDWDGKVLAEKTYHYGDTVNLPSDPVRPEDDDNTYRFREWTPAVAKVSENADYTAVYSIIPKSGPVEFRLDTANGGQQGDTTILIPSDGKTTLSKITSTFAAPDYFLGDINGDGDIDGRDYIVVKKYVLGTADLTDRQLEIADINGDGEVDGIDYLLIKKHVLGTYTIPEPQPVEVPGPDYADFAVIVVDANGTVQTVKPADGKSKSDLTVPAGGYAVAIPKAVLEKDPALKEAIGKLTAQRDRLELLNVSLNGLANANGTALTDVSVRIVFGE